MTKQIVIAEQNRIAAVFSEDQIQELIVATGSHQVGDIYLGIVENVLPGIDAAFVNIGDSERNGFIHVSDLGPLRLRKTASAITELLVPQQKVLVQVMKEPTGNKGPRLTGNITLPGRYLVLMPSGRGVNLSRRIRNENERNRLRALAILVKPAGMGLLVRTEAEGVPEEAIIEDLETLQKQWENVQQEALTSRPPCLLNRDDDFIQRVLRDVHSAEVNRIVTDSPSGVKRVKQHLLAWNGGKTPPGVLIDQHRERTSILEYFRVNAAIREALKPRVDLPSGGYIIIERTEALTVIDVNSGSFTRSSTARETVLWTNCEAADEIARQLRLRNIAGVIVVDFIDMDSHRDKLQVLEQFTKALRADKARPQIAQLTELGLVELTRKRQGQNIYELFGRPCPQCGGLGHLVHLPTESEGALQAVDPVRTLPVLEPRTSVRGLWDPTSLDNESDDDSSGDSLASSLTSHPSYQDRSKTDRRRRRGRSARNGDAPPRTAPRTETPAPPIPVAAPISIPPVVPVAPVVIEEAVPEVVVSERPVKEARPERGGRSRREKAAATPPQVIAVEMTPEEQDLYALMGISPLVLARETVKDPKTAVVSIYLPGMAPSVPSEALLETASQHNGGSVTTLEPEESPAPPVIPNPGRPTKKIDLVAKESPKEMLPAVTPAVSAANLPKASAPKAILTPIEEPSGEPDATTATDSDLSESADAGNPSRRRRRRSSAAK